MYHLLIYISLTNMLQTSEPKRTDLGQKINNTRKDDELSNYTYQTVVLHGIYTGISAIGEWNHQFHQRASYIRPIRASLGACLHQQLTLVTLVFLGVWVVGWGRRSRKNIQEERRIIKITKRTSLEVAETIWFCVWRC